MIASQPFVTRVAQAARPAALADNYLTAGTAIGNITPGHNPVNRSIRRLPCEHQQINIHPSFRLFLKRGKHRFWQSLSAIVVSNKIPIVQSRKRRVQVRQLEHFCPFGLSLAPNPPDPHSCKVTNLLHWHAPVQIMDLDAGEDWLTGKDRRLLTLFGATCPAPPLAWPSTGDEALRCWRQPGGRVNRFRVRKRLVQRGRQRGCHEWGAGGTQASGSYMATLASF